MKKLIGSELMVIEISALVVVIGTVLGWSIPIIATTIIVAVILAVITSIVIPDAGTTVIAANTATVTVTFITNVTVIAIGGTIITAILTAFVAEKIKVKYRWAILSLLREGIVIWAILVYAPGLLR